VKPKEANCPDSEMIRNLARSSDAVDLLRLVGPSHLPTATSAPLIVDPKNLNMTVPLSQSQEIRSFVKSG
jgi:hypothetical protein